MGRGLADVLRSRPDYRLIGCCDSLPAALKCVRAEQPALVLVYLTARISLSEVRALRSAAEGAQIVQPVGELDHERSPIHVRLEQTIEVLVVLFALPLRQILDAPSHTDPEVQLDASRTHQVRVFAAVVQQRDHDRLPVARERDLVDADPRHRLAVLEVARRAVVTVLPSMRSLGERIRRPYLFEVIDRHVAGDAVKELPSTDFCVSIQSNAPRELSAVAD